jgi:hypothetical protein
MYETKAEAIAAVKILQARGVQSIDVGCMQVNLMFHPTAFDSLDDAFDPVANANYAARFLTELYGRTHSWMQATAFYHSATPELGAEYQRKVAAVLPVELRQQLRDVAGGNVWTNNVWTQNVWNTGPGAQPLRPRGAAPPKNSIFAQAGRELVGYRTTPIPIASRAMPHTPL